MCWCVGGENRLTGQSRDASIVALAQVGHPDYEVPLGPTIPAYYGLVASRYMHEYGVTEEDLAEFAVLMRTACADPSRRAIPRADHGRRRDGVEAGGVAAEAAGLLSGLRRRRGLHHQPRADQCGAGEGPRLRAGAYPSACHGGAGLERARRRDLHRQGQGRPRASRYPTCAMPRSTTASPLHSRCCWKTSASPNAARRPRAFAPAISAATARCRSTPMAVS